MVFALRYFGSGLSYRGTDAENHTILLQNPLGVVTTLYDIDKVTDATQRRGRE